MVVIRNKNTDQNHKIKYEILSYIIIDNGNLVTVKTNFGSIIMLKSNLGTAIK
jgi:hypothetical protein